MNTSQKAGMVTLLIFSAILCTVNASHATVTLPRRATAAHLIYPPPIPTPPEISLVAQFLQQKVPLGNPVLLQVTMQNNGRQSAVLLANGDAWSELKISVTNASGRQIRLTPWGQNQQQEQQHREDERKKPDAILMNSQQPLAPGQKITCQIILNRQFKMTKAGLYHVVLTQSGVMLPGLQRTLPFKSNSADIELTEPAPTGE